MSTKNDAIETEEISKESKTKRRRRPIGENDDKKRKPIRLVSSLGEGKLLDRFQNAINEKESKKKLRERGEKDRKTSKEKREREMAKFKAELDALLEDDASAQPELKPKQSKVYVPKLSGTVKGKFKALEQKKKEEEENKISNEKRRRMDRDFIEKKRIQIELAQKKQQGLLADEKNDVRFPAITKPKKKPGKLINNFENRDKERTERNMKKIEIEKKQKLSAELQVVKDYYTMYHEAAKLSENLDDDSESSSSENGSGEKMNFMPKRLSASFTKFDIFERERLEEERKRIREKRKLLLEEEKKLFEEAKLQEEKQNEDEKEYISETHQVQKKLPGALKSSLASFETLARQRLEEERERIQKERKKLLEEEKKHFLNQKLQISDENESDDDEERDDESESNPANNFKRNKGKNKIFSRTPSKLARSLLQFDVLEREKMESKKLNIQKQRQALLKEEKKLFEQAKLQQEEESSNSESDKKDDDLITPGRLDCNRTKFDFLALQRMNEERQRIKNQRNRLLEEEKKLMEEERKKIQELEEIEKRITTDNYEKKRKKPKRLDKSFTEFDVLERQRTKEKEEKMYQEKAKQLEEEKKAFEEARKKMMTASDSDEDQNVDEQKANSNKPKKLSSQLTKFDILEQERMENERLQAQKEKIKELEEELRLFQEQKQAMDQESDDDITSNTKELLRLNKSAPRPKRLSASLTQFDVLEKQRREKERERLQKEKAQQLAEERRNFELNWKQWNNSKDNDSTSSTRTDVKNKPVKKMNVQGKMEAVLKAQEEAERKRIEETKFTRMTVEQQEIYLAKQKQIEFLKEQLARVELASSDDQDSYDDSDYSDGDDDNYYYRYSNEEQSEQENNSTENSSGKEEEEDLEDTSMCSGSTNSSGSYSGAPYFVQTLKNLTVTEGDPVRFDANINANPHPKVTWFFKNRLIRNSPDYQHVIKGTQYSLYMNESFLDDVGEYMCKAVNEKGTATSKAYLFVKEAAE